MKALPVQLTQEIAKEFSSLGHLIKISLQGSTLYFTDKDMNVYYDDGTGPHVWLSRGIRFDEAQYSLMPKVDSISFEIDNVSLEFSAFIQNNEMRGKDCVIYRAAFDSSLQIIGATKLFIGTMDRIEVSQNSARIEVYNQFLKWNTPTPRRKHSVTCPWTFKDPATCRYAGIETWCDKSWDRCTALSNTLNNGSFRFLTSLIDKNISWGRTVG